MDTIFNKKKKKKIRSLEIVERQLIEDTQFQKEKHVVQYSLKGKERELRYTLESSATSAIHMNINLVNVQRESSHTYVNVRKSKSKQMPIIVF